jgi:GH15 family glucan-1,4-alpha-glucosidase
MRCDPRFDYARAPHAAERRSDTEVLFLGRSGDGELVLRLRSSVPMRLENGAAVAEFTLGADASAWFVLEVVLAQAPSPSEQPDYQSDAFKQTVNFWRHWIARSGYGGRWREIVNRSALTLKLLTSRQHGSIVAAPTFGLPETIGGGRNWDYRYTWIRDSSFTLYGLMRLGYTHEADAFMRWVMARCRELEPDGSLQVMYGLDGRHSLPEETLPHLEGYMGSGPVRVGNAAFDHLQLDIYGELMDSVYLYDKYGSPIGYDAWTNIVRLMDWVCANWRRPDEGIWEVRGGRQEFLYSRVMCWVAVDRAIRLATKRSFPAPLRTAISKTSPSGRRSAPGGCGSTKRQATCRTLDRAVEGLAWRASPRDSRRARMSRLRTGSGAEPFPSAMMFFPCRVGPGRTGRDGETTSPVGGPRAVGGVLTLSAA